jgi:hypothetical protein
LQGCLQAAPAGSTDGTEKISGAFLISRDEMPFACVDRFVYFAPIGSGGDKR